MFPKVIKAAAGPHHPGSGSNYNETLPELMVQSSSGSNIEFDSTGDSTVDHSSSVTSYDPGLEPFNNVSSVGRSPPPPVAGSYLSV